jgi:hypothetical protein
MDVDIDGSIIAQAPLHRKKYCATKRAETTPGCLNYFRSLSTDNGTKRGEITCLRRRQII